MGNEEDQRMNPVRRYFKFKNKETEEEIIKVLNSHEGVLEKDAEKYLRRSHQVVKAEEFVNAKNVVRRFWAENSHLSFSDVTGLFNMVLMDMQHDLINTGDDFVNKMKERRKFK